MNTRLPPLNLRALRSKLNLSQPDFWHRVCVTQSGGSRYERGEYLLPLSVYSLILVAYGQERRVGALLKKLRTHVNTKKPLAKPLNPQELRDFRINLGLNQTDFWAKLGANQVSGSSYELGKRAIPMPLQYFLTLAYDTDAEAQKVVQRLRGAKA